MHKGVFASVCLALAAATYAFAGCGSNTCASSAFCGDPDGSADGTVDGNPFNFPDGGGGDGGCNLHCSADLHDVLDCSNHVVQTCPPDQGCGGASCVAACDAAKANKSSVGCDYYAIDPDIIAEGIGACFAAFVANTWNAPVTLAADWGGVSLNIGQVARVPNGTGQSLTYAPLPNGQLAPGGVAVVFLNRYGTNTDPFYDFDCPAGVTPGVTAQDGAIHGTALGKAFHITADHPVVAYDMFPYGGGQSAATSATLLIPTSAWDVNYIGVNAFRKDQLVPEAQPFLQILAAEDGTQVTINALAAIVAGPGVAAAPAHTPTTYNLSAGQYLQITQDAELTGSAILANKPIGVWGGATCLNIDVNDSACDSAHQELFPVAALGHEYVGVRYRNRGSGEESVPWRIVGAVDGTQLSYEPSPPSGAPLAVNRGQVGEFWTPGPFVVKSQDDKHPFYMSAHMTGADQVNPPDRGDPEFVNVLPPAQYLASYVFFTDPT
ncbi:MAG TPA: IgGFc-binding protein, partial [Polyangia bacterium]|nr:IgGFc-binding protein [Polyangia bacterium]